jgi:hypothetical protein
MTAVSGPIRQRDLSASADLDVIASWAWTRIYWTRVLVDPAAMQAIRWRRGLDAPGRRTNVTPSALPVAQRIHSVQKSVRPRGLNAVAICGRFR